MDHMKNMGLLYHAIMCCFLKKILEIFGAVWRENCNSNIVIKI